MSLSAEGERILNRGRILAASFAAGSAIIPLSAWIARPRFTRGYLPPVAGLTIGMVVVAILTAGGLALRMWLDRQSVDAVDASTFHAQRLMAVTLPSAMAELAALAVALLGGFTGFALWYLGLLVPPLLVLLVSWPRLEVEARLEEEFSLRCDSRRNAGRALEERPEVPPPDVG